MSYPKVHFPDGFDERAADEMSLKGWVSAVIEVQQGQCFEVEFIDLARLHQEAKISFDSGLSYYAEHNLIIIPEVTVDRITEAAVKLRQDRFFDSVPSGQS